MNDLVRTGYPGQCTPVAWIPEEEMEQPEWAQIGSTFQQMRRYLPWWLGDWLRYGEATYGETYTQAILYTDKSVESLAAYKWVAGKIEPERRRAELAWVYHRIVAPLPPDEQDYWLQRCIDEGWDSETLWRTIRTDKKDATIPSRLTAKASPAEAVAFIFETYGEDWVSEFLRLLEE